MSRSVAREICSTDSDDPRVAQAIEAYLEAVRVGQRPERSSFLAQHPEIAATLAECLDGLDFIRAAAFDLPRPTPHAVEAPYGLPHGFNATLPLGDYRLIRMLGRGGMGVVYEAEQLSLGRRVALKVLPFAAALDARQLQRFKIEAQAAAQLHHPNIVPVHAIGCERGVHYYVMQLIEGQTVAAAIHSLRQLNQLEHESDASQADRDVETLQALAALSTENSVRTGSFFRTVAQLGIQAAEALEHAHHSGVLHRDVKPANLLLDAHGHLWVADFGLAQILGDPRLTMTGDLLGTCRYMSPEQALPGHGIVDHRTDIYALGVTLYELLTLEPAIAGHDRQEVLHQLATVEISPPRRLNPALPIDLQTIILKAAAREPAERYATAQELADDLRRFVEDKPIRARRPGMSQWLARWARRHWTLVMGTGIALVSGVLALSVSIVLIARARDEAMRQRDAARRAVDQMYTDVAEQWLEHEPQMETLQREFLVRALYYYQEFAREQGSEPRIRLATAQAQRRVGDIAAKLGEANLAIPAYEEALRLLGRLVADFPDQLDYLDALGACQHRFALLLVQEKRRVDADKMYLQAVAVRQRLVAAQPQVGRCRLDLAASLTAQARLYQSSGLRKLAEGSLQIALNLLQELTSLKDEPDYRSQLGETLGLLADLQGEWRVDLNLKNAFDPETVCQQLEGASRHLRLALKSRPRDAKVRQHLAELQIDRAHLLIRLEHLPAAEEAYLEVVRSCERLSEDFPRVPRYRRDLALAYQERGELAWACEQKTDATRDFLRASSLYRDLVEEQPHSAGAARDLARFLLTCPDLGLRDSTKALRLAEIATQLAPTGGDCWATLGAARYGAADWAGARDALSQADKLRAEEDSSVPLYLALTWWQLGNQHLARVYYTEARKRILANPPYDGAMRRLFAEATAVIDAPPRLPETTSTPAARR